MEDQKHIWAPFFFLKNPECSCQYIKSNLGCNLKKIKNMVDLLFFYQVGVLHTLCIGFCWWKGFSFSLPPAAVVGTVWIDQFLKELGPIRFRWFFKVYLKYYLYISSSHFHCTLTQAKILPKITYFPVEIVQLVKIIAIRVTLGFVQ